MRSAQTRCGSGGRTRHEFIWANPIGAAIFGAKSPAALAERRFDRGHPVAAQIARLAATLPHASSPRLERLRGFGAGPWRMLLCACSRIALTDRSPAILVVATEPAGPNLSLADRVRRLFADEEAPVAVFSGDGALLHATSGMVPELGGARSLAALGAGGLAAEALSDGRAEGHMGAGKVVIERLGANGSAVLVAVFAPQPVRWPMVAHAATASEVAPPAPPGGAGRGSLDAPPPLATAPLGATAQAPRVARLRGRGEVALLRRRRVSAPAQPDVAPAPAPATSVAEQRRTPLRFVWQMDPDGRFTIGPGEFTELIGRRPAAEYSAVHGPTSPPSLRSIRKVRSHARSPRARPGAASWSPGRSTARPNVSLVELSGLPVFDRDRDFRGYRGFGVCRDIARVHALMLARRAAPAAGAAPDMKAVEPVAEETPPPASGRRSPSFPLHRMSCRSGEPLRPRASRRR